MHKIGATQSDDLEKTPGHMQRVRSQVPVPDAVIGSARRQRIAVFGAQQLEFGVLLLGHVDHQADHAVRPPRLDHCTAQITHPHDLAGLGNQPIAHLVGMAVRGVVSGIVDAQGLLQIIGVHMRPPEARVSPPLLDGVAEQAFDLRAQEGIAHADFSLPHHAINGFQQAQKALANFHQHLLGDLGDLDQDTLAADHPVRRIRLRVELQTHPAIVRVGKAQAEHRHARAHGADVVGMHELQQRPAERRRHRMAGELVPRRVQIGDLPQRIGLHHRLRKQLQQVCGRRGSGGHAGLLQMGQIHARPRRTSPSRVAQPCVGRPAAEPIPFPNRVRAITGTEAASP